MLVLGISKWRVHMHGDMAKYWTLDRFFMQDDLAKYKSFYHEITRICY